MAELHARSTKSYSLRKVRDCWFLENSYTRKTKRLSFLSEKVQINLEDNLIFADDNVYEIKETESGDTKIEKIDDVFVSPEQEEGRKSASVKETGSDEYDLVNSSEQEVDEISRSIHEVDIRQHESDRAENVEHSSIDGTHLFTNYCGQLPRAQPQAGVTFQVILKDTKLAKLCELRGEMELLVNENGFSFYNIKSKAATYMFSNCWIRGFGTDGTKSFTFEVGRRCPTGEGKIVFTTDKVATLQRITKRIWKIDDKL